MTKKSFYILILTAFSINLLAQNKFEAEIATWYQNKQGAVSISFDDAGYTQYKYAYPTLQKYGMHATFSLVGAWTKQQASYSAEPGYFKIKKMGWQQIIELYQNGNEIAAHGYEHVRYGKRLPIDSLVKQMQQIKKLIENKIHAPVYTMHYPYSFTSAKIASACQKSGFYFGRTNGENINLKTPENFCLLQSKAIINNHNPDPETFYKWLGNAKGKWLILMYHHLFSKDSKEMKILKHHSVINTYSLLPETFEQQIAMLSKTNLWVAPIAKIGRYIQERNQTQILSRHFCKTFKIKTIPKYQSKTNPVPLTIILHLPWTKVSVKGSLNDGMYQVKNGKLLIDFIPGNTIIIKKK